MKKMLLTLLVTVLMGTCLVGCGDNPATPQDGTLCVGKVAIGGALVWAEVVDVQFVLNAIPDCIKFAYDLFSLSSPNALPFVVDVSNSFNSHNTNTSFSVILSSKYTYSSSISSKVFSTTLENCNPLPFNPTFEYQMPYSLSVHPALGIGEQKDLKIFTSKTSEISPFGAVNRALFNQYGVPSPVLRLTSSVNLSLAAHEKMALSVSATVSYKYGVARIDDNGKISYQPWLLTSSTPTTQVQYTQQNC